MAYFSIASTLEKLLKTTLTCSKLPRTKYFLQVSTVHDSYKGFTKGLTCIHASICLILSLDEGHLLLTSGTLKEPIISKKTVLWRTDFINNELELCTSIILFIYEFWSALQFKWIRLHHTLWAAEYLFLK